MVTRPVEYNVVSFMQNIGFLSVEINKKDEAKKSSGNCLISLSFLRLGDSFGLIFY